MGQAAQLAVPLPGLVDRDRVELVLPTVVGNCLEAAIRGQAQMVKYQGAWLVLLPLRAWEKLCDA